MSSVERAVLGITLACAFSVGCVSSDNVPNDNTAGSHAQSGSSDAGTGKAATKDAKVATSNPTGNTTGGNTTGGDNTTGGTTGGDNTTGGTTHADSGTKPVDMGTGGKDGGTTGGGEMMMPVVKVVAGSATKNKCTSYTKASGSMCGGYFCGVTEEQIAAEVPADTLCGDMAATGACDNKLPTALAKCARDIKSGSPLSSNDELKPMIQACVFKDADLKANTPQPCMDCFLTAATCAGDNCLVECLTGDSKDCDACRAKNKCDSTVFTCANLPSPF